MKKLMLVISLLGILILLFIINFNEPQIIKISSINEKMMNENIKISGNIKSIKTYENNFTTFYLKDGTGKIQIICN